MTTAIQNATTNTKPCGDCGEMNCPDCGTYQLQPPDCSEHPALRAASMALREAEMLADEYRVYAPPAARAADATALSIQTGINYLRRALASDS